MRIVVQRCLTAQVKIDKKIVGKIDRGMLVLVGFTHNDTVADVAFIAKKVANMRIFEDDCGKMNLSLRDVCGQILSVSQFTLYADAIKGNRPSFISAARPEIAEPLYDRFNDILRNEYGFVVETGRFGADMKVEFTNDGPVTIILDSPSME